MWKCRWWRMHMAKIERLKLWEKLKISGESLELLFRILLHVSKIQRGNVFLYCLYLFIYLFIFFFFSYRKRLAEDYTPLISIWVTFLLAVSLFYFPVEVRKKRRSGVMHCDYLKVRRLINGSCIKAKETENCWLFT